MEAIIKTNDSNIFNSLLHFLKSLHISVETREEKHTTKKHPVGLCKGEFTVPDNFNDALPNDVISTFYQK